MYVPVYILPTLAVATKFGLMLFKKFSDIKITKLKFLYLKQISLAGLAFFSWNIVF
jgi:hypothetical protein